MVLVMMPISPTKGLNSDQHGTCSPLPLNKRTSLLCKSEIIQQWLRSRMAKVAVPPLLNLELQFGAVVEQEAGTYCTAVYK